MRLLLSLCSWWCIVTASAQEVVPAPVFTLDIPAVAVVRERLASSWYGRLWASPALASVRSQGQDGLTDAATATGIDWPRVVAQTRRIRVTLGAERILTLTTAEPVGPLLASAPIVAQQTEESWAAYYAAVETLDRQVPDPDGTPYPKAPGSLVAIQKTPAGFVLARSSRYRTPFMRMDGWLVSTEERSLRLSTPTDHPPGGVLPAMPVEGDPSLHLDLPRWMDALGLPGAGEAMRASGVGMMDGTVAIDPEHSHEHLRLPGAKLPLRALDRALLERWIPADALAVSAIGIDGAKLPVLADRVAAERIDLAAMIALLRDHLKYIDGTAWFSVVPGDEEPGFVAGLQATEGLDQVIAVLVPAVAQQVAAHTWEPVSVPLGDAGDVVLLRTPECWLVASNARLLTRTGDGAFFIKRAGGVAIPAEALALGVQDNAALVRTIARNAPQLSRFLRSLQDDEETTPQVLPRWMYHARKTVADVLDQVAGLAVVTAPVSVSYLIPTHEGMVVEGRDLMAGLLAFPLVGITATEVLPFVMPEWSRRHHPLWACAGVADALPWYEQTSWSVGGVYAKVPPWSRAQTNTTALASPNPVARGEAMRSLAARGYQEVIAGAEEDDPVQIGWAFALCRDALRDPNVAIRDGAWYGIWYSHRGHEAELNQTVVAALRDADPDLRHRACGLLAIQAHAVRWQHSTEIFYPREPPAIVPLPAAALAVLLELERTESDPQALRSILEALSGYDDPQVLPRLVARLADPQPQVRGGAATAIGHCPAADHDAGVMQALGLLLSDQAEVTEWHWRVGDEALHALSVFPGTEVDALLVGELSHPDPPIRMEVELSRHDQVLQILLQRRYAPAIELVRQRAKASSFKDIQRVSSAVAHCALPEAETLLREWLKMAPPTQRHEVLELLLTRAEENPLHPATMADVVTIVSNATEEVDELAAELVRSSLAKEDLRAAVLPLVIPLLTSDRQPVRKAARDLVNDLVEEPTTPADLARPVKQAIAVAWMRFGAEAFPDYEPPPDPPPKPTNVKDF